MAELRIDTSPGYPPIPRPASGLVARVTTDPPVYGKDDTATAFLAGEFIRWLGEQDEPWFAHVSFISPHPPFIVPEPYNRMYDPSDGPAFQRGLDWKSEANSHPYLAWELGKQKLEKFRPGMKGKVRDLYEEGFRAIRALYWGMISEVDGQLGRIWQALKAADEWGDTIIVLTSDHAEMLGDHFMLGKGGFYDGSYHLPLIIRDPRSPKTSGTTISDPTEAVDLFPTTIDLLGGEAEPHLDGRSLAPFLAGRQPSSWRDAAHWEYDFRSVAGGKAEQHFKLDSSQMNLAVVRSERWKYVHFGGGLPTLLFDLAEDPAELRNLAEDSAYLRKRLECAERLLEWRARHLDRSLSLAELTKAGIAGSFAGQQR